MIRRFLIFLLLIPALAQGALFYKADWEQATQIGDASESSSSPTTGADWESFTRSQPPGSIQVVNHTNGAVRQGKYAGRIFLGGDEWSIPGSMTDTSRGVHRRAISFAGATELVYGQTRWYAWSVYFPTKDQFQLGDTYAPSGARGYSISQLMWDNPAGAVKYIPSMYLKTLAGGGWSVKFGGTGRSWGDSSTGVWHDFLLEYKPHQTDGQAKTYLRWRKTPLGQAGGAWTTVVGPHTLRNMSTNIIDPEGKSADFIVNLYGGFDDCNGQPAPPCTTLTGYDRVLYTDGPWIGESESDVLPFFDDTPPPETTLATPAVALSWEGITWTQSGEANVASWTVRQCWDDRACTESTAATKTATVATPLGKSLLVRVRANPAVPASYEPSAWGEDTELRTAPEPPTDLSLVQQSVTATAVTIPQTVTLSTTGTLDWVHWGLTAVSDVNRKSGATTLIGAMQPIGGGALQRSELASSIYRPIMAWVNGTPTATEADTVNGVTYAYADAVAGSGFRLTATAAATTQRTLKMWVHANKTLARATVTHGTTETTLDFGTEAEQKAYMIAVPYLGTGQIQLDVTKTTVATGTGRLVLLGATLE